MQKELKFSIDLLLLEKAEKFAVAEGKSIQCLFEEYLKMLVHKQDKAIIQLTPIASSLKGAVKAGYDFKKALNQDLSHNHLQ